MKKNPLQFAITREDPELELALLEEMMNPKEVLLICSAGDTVLALRQTHPELKITAFDFNPRQLEHLRQKSIGGETPSGNFESLFKLWKQFFNEFILSPEETLQMFRERPELKEEIFQHPYWEVSFNLHFHDSFLRAMFGDAAVQHAPRGSYPRYFQNVFEKGLKASRFRENPFLQHIFFGTFLETPGYLKNPPSLEGVELVEGTIFDIQDLKRFDVIQLSNIFDWSDEAEIRKTCDLLKNSMKKGARLLVRQINNEAPFLDYLGPDFVFDKCLSEKLLERDRSLFYSRITVVTRN